jgi:alpha-amylase
MSSVCFYFQVHQPFRLKHYDFFKIGTDHIYDFEEKNRHLMERIVQKCYLPTNEIILKLIRKHKGKFKVAYSISGTCLDQFAAYCPEVIDSFKRLAETGCVEFLAETYYHSLSYFYSVAEFERQVQMHSEKIEELFGTKPTVFRNTELIFSNDIASAVAKMDFKAILCEGIDKLLGQRSPNFVYQPMWSENFKCLLKNYKLSDDIAFRFSDKKWKEYPLTPEKYAGWLHEQAQKGDVINLFMDYETFGEHQWEETGIFQFLEKLPEAVLAYDDMDFKTPSEIVNSYSVKGIYNVPYPTSWADTERDLSAWLENSMQQEAFERIYKLETLVKETEDEELLEIWGRLQTSDHFYYISTKHLSDGEVHSYFNPYGSPYDAYINYMNVLTDFEKCIEKFHKEPQKIASLAV